MSGRFYFKLQLKMQSFSALIYQTIHYLRKGLASYPNYGSETFIHKQFIRYSLVRYPP